MNAATNSSFTDGRIMLQSEGAEIYFRRIDLEPLKRSLPNQRDVLKSRRSEQFPTAQFVQPDDSFPKRRAERAHFAAVLARQPSLKSALASEPDDPAPRMR